MNYERARDAYRRHMEPDAESLARVRLNVRRALDRPAPTPPSRRRWVVVGAIAAAAVLAIGLNAWSPSPTPIAPTPLRAVLHAEALTQRQLTPFVAAAFDGEGHATGDTQAPRILWRRGNLHLSVTPEKHIDLHVQTPDALVAVVGTVFTVNANRLGTAVSVAHGEVTVTCVGEATILVKPGQSVFCLPATADRLLNRATALLDQGADHQTILETLDHGLAAPDAAPTTTAQLRFLRIQALGHLDRYAEAADAARAFLKDDPPLHRGAVRDYLTTLEAAGY